MGFCCTRCHIIWYHKQKERNTWCRPILVSISCRFHFWPAFYPGKIFSCSRCVKCRLVIVNAQKRHNANRHFCKRWLYTTHCYNRRKGSGTITSQCLTDYRCEIHSYIQIHFQKLINNKKSNIPSSSKFLIMKKTSTGPFLNVWPNIVSSINMGIPIKNRKKRNGIRNTPPL